MTAVKPLPPHGSHARAVGRPAAGIKGCTCRPCRDANNAYNKLRRYLNDTGRSLTIAAEPAAEHLRTILAAGNGWDRTAQHLGCNPSQIHRLVSGEQKTIGRRRAERILALQPDPAPEALIDATGSIRRVRALTALGHMNKSIASASGLEITIINGLAAGTKTLIRRASADAVDNAYRLLGRTPAPPSRGATRARNRAARKGWPTPEQWDGEIDNPAADPAQWVRDEDAPRAVASIVEDAEWLHDEHGLSWDAVAAQLGVHRNTLHQYRTRVRRDTESAVTL